MSLLVTGFGPFRSVTNNPSSIIVPQLSSNHTVLSVNYEVVEEFADSLKGSPFTSILCLGLNSNLLVPAFELYAHNSVGSEPGYLSTDHQRTVISVAGPQTLGQTFLTPKQLQTFVSPEFSSPIGISYSPGDYLCNFILYSMLVRFPQKKIGFVHIPAFEAMPEKEQVQSIKQLIEFQQLDS